MTIYNKPKSKISYKEAKIKTQQILLSACKYRMVADVPVGIFLSGGYDSSLRYQLYYNQTLQPN